MSIHNDLGRSKRVKRAQLLAGAGTVVLATIAISPAHADGFPAASTVVGSNPSSATVTGGLTTHALLSNQNRVDADVRDNTATATTTGQSGSTSTVSANVAAARASANVATSTVRQTSSMSAPQGGIAALSASDNSAVISSVALDNRLTVGTVTADGSQLTSTGNTISADTIVNRSTTGVQTVATSEDDFSTPGSSSVTLSSDRDDDTLDASGSVVVSSIQRNGAVGSAAYAGGNRIGLTVDSNDLAGSAPLVDANTISATYVGNSANNTAALTAGGLPTFNGSVVVTNAQSNDPLSAETTDGGNDGGGDNGGGTNPENPEAPLPPALPVLAGAQNVNSIIAASVGYDFDGEGEGAGSNTGGALVVSDNAITASASGNEAVGATAGVAGNRITIANGVSFVGNGDFGSGSSSGGGFFGSNGNAQAGAGADLTIVNAQRNANTGTLTASTLGGEIYGDAQSLVDGSVAVTGNRFGTTSNGNVASSAVQSTAGTGSGSIAGSVALASDQINVSAGNLAESRNNEMFAEGGSYNGFEQEENNVVRGASISLTGNAERAAAYGNNSTQNIALQGSSLPLSGEALRIFGGDAANIGGGATISNSQSNIGSAVEAIVDDSYLGAGAYADRLVQSSVAASSNTQEAIAVGNSAVSGLALNGTTVGGGAGLVNFQSNDANSTSSASLSGLVEVDARDVSGSTVSLTDNLQRAIAYGNTATSSVDVIANQVNPASDFGNFGGAFGALSLQRQEANVTATASGSDGPAFGLYIDDDLQDGSSAINSGNTLVAAAYGNQTSTTSTLNIGTIAPAFENEFAPSSIGTIFSQQSSTGAIRASVGGEQVVSTYLDDDVRNSSVAVSDNAVQALAFGNRATGNILNVTGTNIAAANNGGFFGDGLAVVSFQSVNGQVTATQRDEGSAASIGAYVDDEIDNSSIILTGNLQTTQATGNAAVNQLAVSANTLSAAGLVVNQQYADAAVSATAGLAGVDPTPGTPAAPFDFNATVKPDGEFSGTIRGNQATITSGTLIVPVSSLTQAQVNQLVASGWTLNGANLEQSATVLGAITVARYTSLNEGAAIPDSNVVPGLPGTPGRLSQGGVQLTLDGGEVYDSTLRIAGNDATAGAVVNNATNSVLASATLLSGGLSGEEPGVPSKQPSTQLFNGQFAGGQASATADIIGAYRITADGQTEIEDSTIDISGNRQVANALVNVAVNTLTLSGTNLTASDNGFAAGSDLRSQQNASAPVSSTSDLELAAPAEGYGSALSISNNSNIALGVINDVTNTMLVSATNVGGGTFGGSGTTGSDGAGITADHALNTTQDASGRVVSNATTRIANNDAAIVDPESGIVNDSSIYSGSASVIGNVTTAEASANRALNSATATGTAGQGATMGIANTQTSSASVASTAASTARMAVNGRSDGEGGLSALSDGSIVLNGNTTTALARGNTATNALTVASSQGNGFGNSSGISGSVVTATAPAMVLNSQTNGGAVNADATGVYQTTLNSGFGQPAAINSTATVSNNSVAAAAYGNSAVNSLNATALNGSGSGGAVANYQLNTGAVRASAVSVTFGVSTPNSGMSGAALGVSGNQVTATAIGNSVVSTLTSGR